MTDLRCTPLFGSHSADRVTVLAGTTPMIMCGRHADGITPADYDTIRQAEASAFTWPTPKQFDAASALGSDRARAQIAVGGTRPEETPLSGEWADSPSPRGVADAVGFTQAFDAAQSTLTDAIDALAEAWEQGYYDTWEHQGA